MAKKKFNVNRIVIAGAGIGVLIAVIIPVMILVFGIGNPDVLAQQKNPDQLKLPVIPDIPDITPILDDPEQFCTIPQSELDKIAQCRLQTQDETQVTVKNLPADECSQVSASLIEMCNEQIEKLINDIQNDAEPPVPIIEPNGTDTSIDDPFTQICDQSPELILCGDSRSLDLVVRVLKTDSAGVQTTVEKVTGIPRLAFFVEDTSNIDFRTGQLQFEIFVKGDPSFNYKGTGKADVLIGQQSIFNEPLDIVIDGTANEEGLVDVSFTTPTGGLSDLILFKFADNFDRFTDEQITKLRLHVIELNIDGERQQNFGLADQDVFVMDIARDDIKLLITDEKGITTRVYPSDSIIKITGITGVSDPYQSGATRVRTYDSVFYGNGLGCSAFNLISDVTIALSTTTYTTPVPPPTLSGITIIDEEGGIVTTQASGTSFTFKELTRNENYTIKITSPNIVSIPLDFGKSQETKSFTCVQKGKANLISTSSISGNQGLCGYYTVTTVVGLSPTNPVTVTPNTVTCNIPK